LAKKKETNPLQLELFSPTYFMVVDPSVEEIVLNAAALIEHTSSMTRYGIFHPSTIFKRLVEEGDTSGQYQKWNLCGVDTMVTPKRLRSFRHNLTCVTCGRVGNAFLIEHHNNDTASRHLNLYSIDKNEAMLMTVDHILPDSLGGKYSRRNFQTMCRVCNQKKQNMMSRQEINLVRHNIDWYAKNWIDRNYVRALLDLQELMVVSHGTKSHTQFVDIFDKYRKSVKHGTSPEVVAGVVQNIQRTVEHVLLGNLPPRLTTTRPWFARARQIWHDVCHHIRMFCIRSR
jgi:5-methylcytosine-specific restriction endonuclease McrA